MATVIQNLACFEVTLDAKSGRYYFDEDILKGKKINQIWLYFGNSHDYIALSPLTNKPLLNVVTFNEISLYVNIFDLNGISVAKNLALPYLLSTSKNDKYSKYFQYSEIDVNNTIDTQNSFFNLFIEGQDFNSFSFLVYVSYTNNPIELKDNTVNGSFSIEIPIPEYSQILDIKLSDYIPRHYRKYPIKKIIYPNSRNYSYLDIKADNKYIENIPNNLLFEKGSTKEVFFDNLKIDYEESFLRYRGVFEAYPFENEKITFIY